MSDDGENDGEKEDSFDIKMLEDTIEMYEIEVCDEGDLFLNVNSSSPLKSGNSIVVESFQLITIRVL